MKKHQLRSLLKRVERWPKGAQHEAVQKLRRIEGDFFAGPVTMVELNQAHQEALRDKGISFEDLRVSTLIRRDFRADSFAFPDLIA